MTLAEMRARIAALLTELSPLAQSSTRTEEQDARIDAILAEVNDLGKKEAREAGIQAAASQRASYTEPAGNRVSGYVPRGDAPAGGDERDLRSIGRRFTTSPEVESWRQNPTGRSGAVAAGSFRHELIQEELRDTMGPDEIRAIIQTGVLPTDMIMPTFVPGVFRGAEAPLSMRDVLISGRTNSDAITFFRELLYTNAAVEVAQATATAGATGLKPESTLTFEQATAPIVTIAHWIPITRQTIEDAPQLQTYVEQRLLTGLERREDAQLLNGDGAGANMTGILVTSGIQDINAAHFTATPVQNVGTANENINRVRRGKRMVRTTGQANPTFVVLHPTVLESFETFADADRQYLLGSPVSGAGITRLWGMRVVESENIAATIALVGDSTAAAVWDRMDSRVLIDTINDQFVRNMLTLLAEERLGLAVYRPSAFAKVLLV